MNYKEEILLNGLVRYHNHVTEGGGRWMRYGLIDAIQKHGSKECYDRAYEWCSGSAPIGFAMLDLDIANHITLADKFELAVNDCNHTLVTNDITHKGEAFLSDTVAGIPDTGKWDLVVSNPPHCETVSWDSSEHHKRILGDPEWKTHEEFYANIRPRLTDDAELFIIEHTANYMELFMPMATEAGLELWDVYPMTMESTQKLGAYHNPDAEGWDSTWHIMHMKLMEL